MRLEGGPPGEQAALERALVRLWVKLSARQRGLVVRYASRLANLPRSS